MTKHVSSGGEATSSPRDAATESLPIRESADAADAGRLRLRVVLDERSAGFIALGAARAHALNGHSRCAAVVTTSGTAVSNLQPAVSEADAAGTGGGRQRGSRLPQMVAASVVFPTVFRQARPRAGSVVLRARQV